MDGALRQRLTEKLARINGKRERFLDALAALSAERLTTPPASDRWSLLQVAEHLMLAERELAQQLQAGDRAAMRQTLKSRFMYRMVRLVIRLGIRVKVPSTSLEPGGAMSLTEVSSSWDASQSALRASIQPADDAALAKPCFVHPVSGPMTLDKALALLEAHFDGHLRKVGIALS